jgi:adenine phosphoribosyltransferase
LFFVTDLSSVLMQLEERLKQTIRNVNDYPTKGIVFKDITPVLSRPELVKEIVDRLVNHYKSEQLDAIVATEARGFIFGGMLAHQLGCRFVPVRKSGKLPYRTLSREYDLEYGKAMVEMHEDAIEAGWKVMIHDDLLATGGTASASAHLVQQLGGTVSAFSFLINLSFLPGEKNLVKTFGVQPFYLVSF